MEKELDNSERSWDLILVEETRMIFVGKFLIILLCKQLSRLMLRERVKGEIKKKIIMHTIALTLN